MLLFTECDAGTFGLECAMMCHCENGVSCDRFTGVCPGPCSQGWLGTSCQTGWSTLIVSYSYSRILIFLLSAQVYCPETVK